MLLFTSKTRLFIQNGHKMGMTKIMAGTKIIQKTGIKKIIIIFYTVFGRLLSFTVGSLLERGAYWRWALIRGGALI